MEFENNVLSKAEKLSLSVLLSNTEEYQFSDISLLLDGEIKCFIAPREHLVNVYLLRYNNTSKVVMKVYLAHLIDSLSKSQEIHIRVSFAGAEGDRIVIFTDVGFHVCFGLLAMEASKSVKFNKF